MLTLRLEGLLLKQASSLITINKPAAKRKKKKKKKKNCWGNANLDLTATL
jgi:hypothetical protein